MTPVAAQHERRLSLSLTAVGLRDHFKRDRPGTDVRRNAASDRCQAVSEQELTLTDSPSTDAVIRSMLTPVILTMGDTEMTEAEMRAATMLVEVGDIAVTFMGAWVSLTFAYLTAAYFVGRALSRFQCWTISIFYVVMAAVFAMSAVGYVKTWRALYLLEPVIFGRVWEFGFPWWGELSGFFFYGGIFVSLYFMYNIRQTDKE